MNERKTINYRNHKLCYSISGSGTPLILIHGFGEDSRIWEPWIRELSQSYRVITPDLPGSGHSDIMADQKSGLEEYADAIGNVLESEHIDKCIMAGHSMGGYIALSFAERKREMLKGLCLVHSTCFADNEEKKEIRKRSIAFIRKNGGREFLQTSVPGLFHNAALHTKIIKETLTQMEGISPEVLIQYQEAMLKRPDRSHVPKSLSVPFFFQIGRHDQAVSFESSLLQCHLPAISEIQILRNCAHMGMLEEPAESLRGISSYLSHLS